MRKTNGYLFYYVTDGFSAELSPIASDDKNIFYRHQGKYSNVDEFIDWLFSAKRAIYDINAVRVFDADIIHRIINAIRAGALRFCEFESNAEMNDLMWNIMGEIEESKADKNKHAVLY